MTGKEGSLPESIVREIKRKGAEGSQKPPSLKISLHRLSIDRGHVRRTVAFASDDYIQRFRLLRALIVLAAPR
jgi:hypothetical protein